MINLEIIDYSSGDVDSVWNWVPASNEDIFFQLSIEVSEVGCDGGNQFQLVVATPEGIRSFMEQHDQAFLDRSLIVLREYSFLNLKERLTQILNECSRDSWNESIACLQRYFQWEYEDCRQE